MSGGGIQNNLVTTEAGYSLDARQGKVLDEKIMEQGTSLENKINNVKTELINNILLPYGGEMPNNADFNDYKTQAWYLNDGTNHGQTNAPSGGDNGYLIVFKGRKEVKVRQIWIGTFSMLFKTRTYANGTWTAWQSFVLE